MMRLFTAGFSRDELFTRVRASRVDGDGLQ
jgi:hypothetical protein